MADQIAQDPLRPYSFVLEWGSHTNTRATHLLDTPLVPYYIALISAIFGRSEAILHSSFILFTLIGSISFYFLARKFVRWPLTATLVMVSTPTFLVSSHSLMLDAPMASLFLLAAALFVYGLDRNNRLLMLMGSIAAGFAYLAKPNGIFLIPLLSLYCILKRKPRYITYQLIPVLFIVLFSVHNYFFEDMVLIKGYVPFLYGGKESNLGTLAAYTFSNLSYIGGATLFTLFLFYPFILKKRNWALLAAAGAMSAAVSYLLYGFSADFVSGQYSVLQISLFFLFVCGALCFILVVCVENHKNTVLALRGFLRARYTHFNPDMLFLFAWLAMMLLLNSFISGGAVRYNVLLVPPLVLSYLYILPRYLTEFRIRQSVLHAAAALTLAAGLLVAYADYELAGSYREFADTVPEQYKTGSNSIYYTGSLGFQYYMTANGYTLLMQNDNTPRQGDYVIRARLPSPRMISDELMQRLQIIETVQYHGTTPIKVQNPKAHAGFYTYGGGFLPYSFSNTEIENFDVYYVRI